MINKIISLPQYKKQKRGNKTTKIKRPMPGWF